jgi:hypothetical protein
MSFECIKSDGRRRGLASDWDSWLREADRLYGRYLDEIDASPFEFNEVSAVGFLTVAAARCDFLTLNEYEISKSNKLDRRKKAAGRADLWISGKDRTYSFEFKRAWYAATIKNLEATMSRARGDISAVHRSESNYAAGVVLAYVNDEARIERYRKFADHEHVDFAYRLGPDGTRGTYLYFSIKEN